MKSQEIVVSFSKTKKALFRFVGFLVEFFAEFFAAFLECSDFLEFAWNSTRFKLGECLDVGESELLCCLCK